MSRNRSFFLALVFFFLAIAVLLSQLPWDEYAIQLDIPLLVLLGMLCIAPAVIGLIRNKFFIFEPVHTYSLSTFVYFVIVPLALIYNGDFYFAGINYRPGLPRVILLASFALIGFYIGYFWERYTKDSEKKPGYLVFDNSVKEFIHAWSVRLLIFFSVLVALWIVVARIPLSTLWVFGEASYGDSWRQAQGVQIGYLYAAREALPACLLLLIASRSTKKWRVWHILLLVSYTLLLSGPGGRYYALLPTVGTFVFYFLERKRSPKFWQVLLVIFIIFYFIVGGLGFYRNPGIEIGKTEFNFDTAWQTFVGGSQLVLSTAASIYVVPSYSDYLYGYSFIQLATQPIPRFLWPAKPSWFGPSELSSYWSYSAAAPFWVSFYLNFGYIGVIIGTMILGWFSRKIFDGYRNDPQNIIAQVLLAVYIPFMIHGYGRGSNEPAFVIYGFIYVILPVLLMKALIHWRFKSHLKVDYDRLNISIESSENAE